MTKMPVTSIFFFPSFFFQKPPNSELLEHLTFGNIVKNDKNFTLCCKFIFDFSNQLYSLTILFSGLGIS